MQWYRSVRGHEFWLSVFNRWVNSHCRQVSPGHDPVEVILNAQYLIETAALHDRDGCCVTYLQSWSSMPS